MLKSGHEIGLVGWGNAVERLLATETIRSERRRSEMLAAVLVLLLIVVLVITNVPGLVEKSLQSGFKAAAPRVLLLLIAAAAYELATRWRLGRLLDRGDHPGNLFRYVNAFVEISIPTAFFFVLLQI